MIRIERIVCPIDLSDLSRRALDHAAAVARWYGAPVWAVHVVPRFVPPTPGITPVPVGPPPVVLLLDPALREPLERRLDEFVAPARAIGVDVRVELLDGDAAQEILRRAAELDADLVVLGTHGGGAFERLFLGSVAHKVLRKASCPVMTVGPAAEGRPLDERVLFRRIICAVDFSETSLRALEYARALAEEARARLIVLHVLESLAEIDSPAHLHFNVGDLRRQRAEEALARLKSLERTGASDSLELEAQVSVGKAYEGILHLAAETAAELIVMGAHGRRLLDFGRFGSTMDHVVREASCPVLTVRGRP